jgi:large subunit ribosomal protein L24
LVGSLSGRGSFALENGRLARLDPAAFGGVMRAVDQGLPIDQGRIGERIGTGLAAGALIVPHAEGTISLNSGRARLSNMSAPAQGADLVVTGSLDLAEATVDARLALLGHPDSGVSTETRPEVVIMLKGAVDAPRRSIEVAALTSWLALRAVAQQSQKLDLLERAPPPAPTVPPTPAPAAVPKPLGPSPIGEREPAGTPSSSAPPAALVPAGVPPAEVQAEPEAAHSPPPSPTHTGAPKAKPQAPAERAPLDIRPAPPRPPRAQTGGGQAQAKQPAVPPRPRSLSEFLFGN